MQVDGLVGGCEAPPPPPPLFFLVAGFSVCNKVYYEIQIVAGYWWLAAMKIMNKINLHEILLKMIIHKGNNHNLHLLPHFSNEYYFTTTRALGTDFLTKGQGADQGPVSQRFAINRRFS